jgi:hypothetical protein
MSKKVTSCKFCGTEWHYDTQVPGTTTGWSGFLDANMYAHWSICEQRTPQERIAWAKRTEKRIARKPNEHTRIVIDYTYPGMKAAQ